MARRGNILLVGGVVWLALFGVAMAGPLEDGQTALQRNDYATALQIFRPLAEQGDADAQFNVGSMYEQGEGVPQDTEQAVAWLRKAADQGSADAQLYLGGMYEQGRGVPHDYAQAAAWYRKAADQGSADAQLDARLNLGGLYANGQGVPQDYVQAYMWFNLAAANASWAREKRDSLAAKMTPDQIAEAQRMARDWKPTK